MSSDGKAGDYHEAWQLVTAALNAERAYAAWERDRASIAYAEGTWQAEYKPLRDTATDALQALANYLAANLAIPE